MSYVQSFGVSCSILIQIGPKITVNANFETTKGLRWYKIRSKTQKARQAKKKNKKMKNLKRCTNVMEMVPAMITEIKSLRS